MLSENLKKFGDTDFWISMGFDHACLPCPTQAAGFEPSILGLQVEFSTTVLLGQNPNYNNFKYIFLSNNINYLS